MGSCDLVEQHRPHLGEQVHDHERRFRARSGLLCLRSNLLCCACSLRMPSDALSPPDVEDFQSFWYHDGDDLDQVSC